MAPSERKQSALVWSLSPSLRVKEGSEECVPQDIRGLGILSERVLQGEELIVCLLVKVDVEVEVCLSSL